MVKTKKPKKDSLRFFCFNVIIVLIFVQFFLSSNAEISSEKEIKGETPMLIQEDKEAKLFLLKCAGCHTFGDGDLSGPDLIKSAKFSHDDLLKAISRMQEQVGPLSKEEMDELAKFLKAETVSERIRQETQRIAKLEEAKLEPPNAKIGRELFLGVKPFKNGGLSCISCHKVASTGNWGGGKLGPSLEKSFNKFGKHNLASAIENCNWKVMKEAYKNHPITKQEAIHLVGFFRLIKDEPLKDSGGYYHIFSGIGCLSLYLLTALFYSKRLRGVRKKLERK